MSASTSAAPLTTPTAPVPRGGGEVVLSVQGVSKHYKLWKPPTERLRYSILGQALRMQMAHEPELFIIDEAPAVSDIYFQSKCSRMLKQKLADGMTLPLVSHDPGSVRTLCARASARPQEDGPPRAGRQGDKRVPCCEFRRARRQGLHAGRGRAERRRGVHRRSDRDAARRDWDRKRGHDSAELILMKLQGRLGPGKYLLDLGLDSGADHTESAKYHRPRIGGIAAFEVNWFGRKVTFQGISDLDAPFSPVQLADRR